MTWYIRYQYPVPHPSLCHGLYRNGDTPAYKRRGWQNGSSHAKRGNIYPIQPYKAHRDRTSQCESVHRSDHKYVLPESGDRFRLPAPDSTHGPILPHLQIVRRILKPLHWRCSVEWKGVPPALSDGHSSSPPHRLQSPQRFRLPWLHRQWYASMEYLYHR